MGSSLSILDPIVLSLIKGETVLDAGCGYGRWGSLIYSNSWESGLEKPPVVDGLDAFKPNAEFCKKLPFYRKVWEQELPSELKDKWDTVLASEIIEHIPKKEIKETLRILEQAAKKRIIITTPNWPSFREGSDSHLGYNKYEAHLSYVSAKYLKKRGYKIIGTGFGNPSAWYIKLALKVLSSKKNTNVLKKTVNSENINISAGQMRGLIFAMESLPRIFPSMGHTIVAYKDIRKVGSKQQVIHSIHS